MRMKTPVESPWCWQNIHKPYLIFMIVAHGLAVWGVGRALQGLIPWPTVALAAVFYTCCVLSLTGGYHRLFSHAAYRGHPLLRVLYLLFGAASGQNSALLWAADHRRHHAHADQEGDPYNIKKGFWWAYVGWVIHRGPPPDISNVQDLAADPLIQFQHRFYLPLGVLTGAVLPAVVGLAWHDPLGAFLWAGVGRIVAVYHLTFGINSVAHTFGRQPHGQADTARDNLFMAIVTLGEGYHNYHHTFPSDYRAGVRWYHFDPTKWWIWLMAQVGATTNLKRVVKPVSPP